ncbi:hypothetical protein HLB44_15915 [Aquincola sp. S2]|uniref:DUF1488 family protein n=1 Tax=Pseudaquabacterium terrae TaxID=2732868 RepID=A0ABX2EIN0_9BURK|nr:hypothetical protein [Aquabacterium terrae]NRF68481.1 hypothetical protein [Aquabacterium terrae]
MQTFMARFVRPNGERGVIYVVAASAAVAMLDVMRKQGRSKAIEGLAKMIKNGGKNDLTS